MAALLRRYGLIRGCILHGPPSDQPHMVSTLLRPLQGTHWHGQGSWYGTSIAEEKRGNEDGENNPTVETVANQHNMEQTKDSLETKQKTRRRKKASIVEMTDSALERMRMLLEKHRKEAKSDDDVYIRLGVKRRGCNGLAYTLNYDSTKKKFDEEVDYSEPYGVKMLVDAGAIMHVLGTRMDYVEDDLRAEFVFVNPNASGTCGCGESFTTQSDEFKRAKE